MTAAYIIAEVSVHDPHLMEEYKKLTPATLIPFGGKFIIRGGKTIALEGDWNPQRMVVLEFPSKENALSWWNSEMYLSAKQIRQKAALTKMILIEGL